MASAPSFNPKNILILKYRNRKIALSRDQCHNLEDLISFALLSFGSLEGIPVDNVVLVAKIPGVSDTDPVEVTPKLWPTVSRVVDIVTIMLESERDSPKSSSTLSESSDSPVSPQKARPLASALLPNPPTLPLPQHPPFTLPACQDSLVAPQQTLPMSAGLPQLQNRGSATFGPQTINVTCFSSGFHYCSVPPPFSINEDGLLGRKVSYLCQRIQTRLFGNSVISNLLLGSLSLDRERTLSSYAMCSGSTVTATLVSKQPQICKSIIYLYPSAGLANATVKLTLVPSWNFSTSHPNCNKVYGPGMSITWYVAAEPNGTLVEKTNGTEVSYLHWEAYAHSKIVTYTSPATNPMANSGTFDPLNPSVNPGDSVLLPQSKLPEYLDVALQARAPHREARNSFIKYWLPVMQKHSHVALRFVTQESWEKAVKMHITPAPDIVTRVFMLFHGVAATDLNRWEQARVRAVVEDGETVWEDVDVAHAADLGLFRVLELGGMEV